MFLTDAMYWFAIYLASGVVVLLVTRLAITLTRKPGKRSQWPRDVMRAIADTRSNRIKLQEIAQKLLFTPLILLLWPVAVGMVIQALFFCGNNKPWTPDPEDAFTCHRKHLVRVVSPHAAQVEAHIVDPLDRVPAQPFGHLNAGWTALLATMEPADTLWYFEVPGYTPGPDDLPQRHQWSVPQGARRGYALVQSGKVRAEFIFEWD